MLPWSTAAGGTYENTLPGTGHRRDHRYQLAADVLVVPLGSSRSRPFWATTEDLSRRGALINASRLLPEHLPVMLEIHARGRQPMRIKAIVVHRIEDVGFGCRFVAMTARTEALLRAALTRVPIPVHRAA
jgi:hypothetical protein